MEAGSSTETFLNIYQNTRRQVSEKKVSSKYVKITNSVKGVMDPLFEIKNGSFGFLSKYNSLRFLCHSSCTLYQSHLSLHSRGNKRNAFESYMAMLVSICHDYMSVPYIQMGAGVAQSV
jgi:hypothetical protein